MITLELAERMADAVLDRADELGALVSVAIVDSGGHLVVFRRMDGAEIAGPTLAVDKAFTAVAHRATTAELGALSQPGGPLWGLSSASGGRYVVFAGGVPCWLHGRVAAGVGVSGGTAAEDAEAAAAGLEAFRSLTPDVSGD